MKIWQREFQFLQVKFSGTEQGVSPKFSKLRPPNFPTIRLSQLANLYHLHQNLFSKLISTKTISEIYTIFEKVKARDYWFNHFNFGKPSTIESEKTLTRDFIDLYFTLKIRFQ
jgi:hypothetical protein